MQRHFSNQEKEKTLKQLIDYGFVIKEGDKIGLRYSLDEMFDRCAKVGITMRPPLPDDDVATLLACFLADLVIREKVFEKPNTKMSKRDFDNLFYAYGQFFYFVLDKTVGAAKIRRSWYNYTKKHLRQVSR